MSPDAWSIGEVARRAGLRPSAIRFYEQAGVIPPAGRARGRRCYDPAILEPLRLIRLAQEAGFTLREVKRLFHGFGEATASVRWRTLAQRKILELTERIVEAERMLSLLERLSQCECETLEQCVRPHLVRLTTRSISAA